MELRDSEHTRAAVGLSVPCGRPGTPAIATPTSRQIPIPSLNEGIKLHFQRDQVIFNEADEARFIYRVGTGGVRLCRMCANGRRQIMSLLLPDDLFGFEHKGRHSVSAEALCESFVTRYPRAVIERLADESHNVQQEVMTLLHREIADTQEHVVMLGRHTAKERVAILLLQLALRSGAASGATFHLPMCRSDIADYLGLTLETVCRTITELKHAKLITVPGRSLVAIPNLDKLAETANCNQA